MKVFFKEMHTLIHAILNYSHSEYQAAESVSTNRSLLQRAEKYNWCFDFVGQREGSRFPGKNQICEPPGLIP